MAKTIKRVAVIGAGPAGAIAVDALASEEAFDVIRVFERRECAGGCWSVCLIFPVFVSFITKMVKGRVMY